MYRFRKYRFAWSCTQMAKWLYHCYNRGQLSRDYGRQSFAPRFCREEFDTHKFLNVWLSLNITVLAWQHVCTLLSVFSVVVVRMEHCLMLIKLKWVFWLLWDNDPSVVWWLQHSILSCTVIYIDMTFDKINWVGGWGSWYTSLVFQLNYKTF